MATATAGNDGADRGYEDAVNKLNTLQSGFQKIQALRKVGAYYGDDPVGEQREWFRRIGYQAQDFNRLGLVHVAGTKGKGSTCAYVDSILNQYRLSKGFPTKIGLFTSPHLIEVRERIQINLKPISQDNFAKYFFEVWDKLEESALSLGEPVESKPGYFRYLTLVAFHAFLRENVDAAIFEVGIGGEHDSTNIIDQPVATGITTLGLDHVELLGRTIDKIAWQKAGIFKKGCPAFSVPQVDEATPVLIDRAKEKDCKLAIVPTDERLRLVGINPDEDFQRKNASLAVQLAAEYLTKLGGYSRDPDSPLPQEFKTGLEVVAWRGRCEIIVQRKQTWYVDGAHTVDSLNVAGQWFSKAVEAHGGPRIMIFNQQSARDSIQLLKTLHQSLSMTKAFHFDHVIFTTNITYKTKSYKADFQNNNLDTNALLTLNDQKQYAETWKAMDHDCKTDVVLSIEEAFERVDEITAGLGAAQIFAAGSLHLVGGVLFLLGERDKSTLPSYFS